MERDMAYKPESAGLDSDGSMKLYKRILEEEREKDKKMGGLSLMERLSLGKAEERAWDRLMKIYVR